MVAGAEDLLAAPIQNGPALRHLIGYLDLLIGNNDIGSDPTLDEHFAATLLDLTALALGANIDSAEIAHNRGQRTARLQQILAEIRVNYSKASFSAGQVARKLG